MKSGVNFQQVRFASKSSASSGVQYRATSGRTELRRFLGPKNFKGFHKENPFFFPPTNHQPSYITRYPVGREDLISANLGYDWKKVFERGPRNNFFDVPFPQNRYTKTSRLVTEKMKADIVRDIRADNLSPQQASVKYGLSVPRIEAIVTLAEIRDKWRLQKKITPALGRLKKTMDQMFPYVQYNQGSIDAETGRVRPTDDLMEIPVLAETKTQRFLSIAESEPFGPVDAANFLDIEDAATTLTKLNEHEHIGHSQTSEKEVKTTFIATQLENESSLFQFTSAKVGHIGHRYGAARDDQKRSRKVRYTGDGRMVYA